MKFSFTTIYGLHTVGDRKSLWHELRQLHTVQHGPWVAMRDFNAVLTEEDRINGAPIHENETVDFKEFIQDYNMAELRSVWAQFTWSNNTVSTRIYRGVGNAEWMLDYPLQDIVIMAPYFSHHAPLAIQLMGQQNKSYRPFRVFNFIAEHA
ncbi:uncharacterized protein [Nicotiana tomentosiformis]|uniref:uncharacterized protein n=1 Tax=Nicotiana tomentosiformis TaxID=4098 RepID=UPI00388C80B7